MDEFGASTKVDAPTRIPALDGVRAVAIALVLIGHASFRYGSVRPFGAVLGGAGVEIFFVLSGFLVTRVMLLDEKVTGRLHLGRFYARRALRIFPAFYVFWAVLTLLFAVGTLPFPGRAIWLGSAVYVRNFLGRDWNTAHLWSLALEEQFYLFWPVAFVCLASRRRRLAFIVLATVAATLWRFHVVAQQGGHLNFVIFDRPQTRMDTFLIGAACALIRPPRWVASLLPRFVLPFLVIWFENAYGLNATAPIAAVVTGLTVGILLLWLVQSRESRPAYYLSHPAVVYVGALSYSLYLWQQMFLGPHLHWWSFFALVACAWVSYNFVERPALRLKERLGSGVSDRQRSRATSRPLQTVTPAFRAATSAKLDQSNSSCS